MYRTTYTAGQRDSGVFLQMVVKAVPFSSETIPDVSVPRDSMSDHWYRKGAHHLSSRRLISESACFGFSRDLDCLV